jgi:hypothetical protein
MKLEITPNYEPITEKEFCCVPAVLQMIQTRRGFDCLSQDEIGHQLGLIVPKEPEHLFERVRTGPEPKAGYGTQTSKEEFSIAGYFRRNGLPLKLVKTQPHSLDELHSQLTVSIQNGDDVIICYNSRLLFGDGDNEHVSLVQELDLETRHLLVVDPAIDVPKLRETTLDRLYEVLNAHDVNDHGGLWIVSSRTPTSEQ